MSSKIRVGSGAKELLGVVIAECERLGLPKPVLSSGSKSFRLLVDIDGHQRAIAVPQSPSDRRAHKSAVRFLRHLVRDIRGAVA